MATRFISTLNFYNNDKVVNQIEPKYQKPFIVRFYINSNFELSCSATYEEVMKAFDTGAVIIGEYYDEYGELVSKTRNVSVGSFEQINE